MRELRDDDDLIGTSEAAEILGVKPPQITRLRENGRMPKPAAELAATDVWHRASVEAVQNGNEPSEGDRIKGLAGLAESAKLFKVDKSQIGRWRRAGTFPEPKFELRAGPVWLVTELRAWKRERDKVAATKARAKARREKEKAERKRAREAKARLTKG